MPTLRIHPPWYAPELQVPRDPARTARYRLHQSWYREAVLGVAAGERPGLGGGLVGNVLAKAAVEADPSLNFIDDAAYRTAVRRTEEVRREGGTLEVRRLFHNLLSSMPMCFNLFGALGEKPGCLEILRGLFDPEAATVDEVICEITPTPALGDRTAFDAMIRYRDGHGRRRFIAIETKYTEPFSPRQYDSRTYREVTANSGWFEPDAADSLVGSTTNQLWRGLMLAAVIEQADGAVGRYAVVSTADDNAAIRNTELAAGQLCDPSRLRFVSIESIVDVASDVHDESTREWAAAFGRRYLLSPDSVPPEA